MKAAPGGRADALVLFGATGDLARKKLFPALYHLEVGGRLDHPVVGVALSDWDDDGLRRYADDAVRTVVGDVDDAALGRFTDRLRFVSGDYDDPSTFTTLAEGLRGTTRPAHYLAIPPRCSPPSSAACGPQG